MFANEGGKSETPVLQNFFEVRREYGRVRRKYEEVLGSTEEYEGVWEVRREYKGSTREYGKYGSLAFPRCCESIKASEKTVKSFI